MNELTTTQDHNPADCFSSIPAFESTQRFAKSLAAGGLLPDLYRGPDPSATANVMIALEMAARLNVHWMEVMQNLYVVHGRPAWSAKFLIGRVATSGTYEPLRYEWRGTEGEDSWSCRAWTAAVATGEVLQGAWFSVAQAKKRGYWDRKGSHWPTMTEQMLMYRAATQWVNAHAPHLGFGVPIVDEVADGDIVAEQSPGEVTEMAELNRKLLGQAEAADIGDAQ